MTRTLFKKKKCVICGKEDHFTTIISTNSFGSMDLDTRSPGMARYNLGEDIQTCRKCFYSNYDISKPIKGIKKKTLKETNYRSFAKSIRGDKTARSYILAGHLYAMVEKWYDAGKYYLTAAWRYDDIEKKKKAKKARIEAIKYFKLMEEPDEIDHKIIMVDMLRRIGEFEEAKRTAEEIISLGAEDEFKEKVLKFEIELSEKEDDGCHTVENLG